MTLTEAVSNTIRRLHYSPRTEEAYLHWVREFVHFHRRRHPREMGAAEVTAFLNDLAVHRRASASTQNQALCALVFLYRKVLELEMPALDGLERAQRPQHLPNVLSRRDVVALLGRLEASIPPAGAAPLRRRAARSGGPLAAGEGHRPRPPPDHRATRQGRARPRGPPAPPSPAKGSSRSSTPSDGFTPRSGSPDAARSTSPTRSA
jgi:hypothetical protein